MKKLKKILLWFLAIIAVTVFSAMSYVRLSLPDVGKASDLKIDATPERLSRGEYLANHVAVCIDCHSQRDWTRFSGPPKEGTWGTGGEVFDQKQGFPGKYFSRNITPEGIGRYTDGELFRAITTGVTREGKAMFPIMPYTNYGKMDEEDIKSIIAYIRTLQPVKNHVPESSSDFPMNFIINTLPRKASFTDLPPVTDRVNYGSYLVNAAGCLDCHSRFKKGNLVKGTEFGGGREFQFPDGSILRSSNISPDQETGLGKWTADQFVQLFHSRADSSVLHTRMKPGDFNTVMPWTMYGRMKEEDLRAVFAYLKSVPPVKNPVNLFTPAGKNKTGQP